MGENYTLATWQIWNWKIFPFSMLELGLLCAPAPQFNHRSFIRAKEYNDPFELDALVLNSTVRLSM